MTKKECIRAKFSEGLGIFDNHYGYPEIDYREKYSRPTGKVKDFQSPQAHAGRNFLILNRRTLDFDLNNLHYLIKIIET